MSIAIVILFALSFGGIVWFVISGLDIRAGWQAGNGVLARWLDGRRRAKFEAQLPDALGTMSNALRAGFSLSQAFDSVVDLKTNPISEEFEIMQKQQRIGMSLEDALESMSSRVGSDDLTLVTMAILISRKTGGNITEIFDKISDTIRGRAKVARKVKSLTAQGRMQGAIVSAMPLFLGIVMTAIKPSMMIPFLTSPAGALAILAMLVLITCGWLMIGKIVKIDV